MYLWSVNWEHPAVVLSIRGPPSFFFYWLFFKPISLTAVVRARRLVPSQLRQLIMAVVKYKGDFARWALLGSLLSLLRYTRGKSSMNVALHAQVPPSKDMVVGSTVTMAGVRQALLSRGHSGNTMPAGGKDYGNSTTEGRRLREENTTIFYPFHYDGLHDRSWDLVIIEGWFWMINAFIHEVRTRTAYAT